MEFIDLQGFFWKNILREKQDMVFVLLSKENGQEYEVKIYGIFVRTKQEKERYLPILHFQKDKYLDMNTVWEADDESQSIDTLKAQKALKSFKVFGNYPVYQAPLLRPDMRQQILQITNAFTSKIIVIDEEMLTIKFDKTKKWKGIAFLPIIELKRFYEFHNDLYFLGTTSEKKNIFYKIKDYASLVAHAQTKNINFTFQSQKSNFFIQDIAVKTEKTPDDQTAFFAMYKQLNNPFFYSTWKNSFDDEKKALQNTQRLHFLNSAGNLEVLFLQPDTDIVIDAAEFVGQYNTIDIPVPMRISLENIAYEREGEDWLIVVRNRYKVRILNANILGEIAVKNQIFLFKGKVYSLNFSDVFVALPRRFFLRQFPEYKPVFYPEPVKATLSMVDTDKELRINNNQHEQMAILPYELLLDAESAEKNLFCFLFVFLEVLKKTKKSKKSFNWIFL